MVLEAGAGINVVSQRSGYGALSWASRRGDLPIVAAILESADVREHVAILYFCWWLLIENLIGKLVE
jgi:hypothetical protein